MGIFDSKETKEAKRLEKEQALLSRYGLQDLSDPQDLDSVKKIAGELAGNGLIEFGTILSGKSEDVAKISSLRAIIEQNFIMIRQLDRISKALEK